MVRVKICGITNPEDAHFAADSGADALGFVFFEKSPRNISPEAAAHIVAELPPFVTKVGVFVDSSLEMVEQVMSFCKLDLAQLHGEESPDLCQALYPRAVKAFRVDGHRTLDHIASYRAAAYLLDTYSTTAVGGTGKSFDWEVARELGKSFRVILAGGLSPANVNRAITLVQPYGVDVSTGVESWPGKKDPALVRAFMQEAKGVMRGKGEYGEREVTCDGRG